MKRSQKKTPADYPQFAFRMKSVADKLALDMEIDRVVQACNEALKDGEKTFRKNEIIIEAIIIGLKAISRRLS
jgi:hypothetical protein